MPSAPKSLVSTKVSKGDDEKEKFWRGSENLKVNFKQKFTIWSQSCNNDEKVKSFISLDRLGFTYWRIWLKLNLIHEAAIMAKLQRFFFVGFTLFPFSPPQSWFMRCTLLWKESSKKEIEKAFSSMCQKSQYLNTNPVTLGLKLWIVIP